MTGEPLNREIVITADPGASDESQQEAWTQREACAALRADEVQVWRASAFVGEAALDRYRAVLSKDEIEHMGRMRAGVGRDEFVVARGLLRMLLGGVLKRESRSLVFSKGRYGKPEIEGAGFNVSHSKGLILIAIGREAEVGIDVEWVDATIEALEIARQSFSTEESECIAEAEAGCARTRLFYECWTRKEALAKAHGAGLFLPLASFTVPMGAMSGEAVEVRPSFGADGERFEEGRYFLHDLEEGKDFLACLAVNRAGLKIRRLRAPIVS